MCLHKLMGMYMYMGFNSLGPIKNSSKEAVLKCIMPSIYTPSKGKMCPRNVM